MTFLIGLLIGLSLGLTGSGGSIFALPLLIHGLGVPTHQAIGLSLGAVSATACYGFLTRIRAHDVLWVPAIIFAASGAVMAPVGNAIGRTLPGSWLLMGFAILVVYIATRMWKKSLQVPENAKVVRAYGGAHGNDSLAQAVFRESHSPLRPPSKEQPSAIPIPIDVRILSNRRNIAIISLGGMGTGLISGLFGVGGGFLIVPLMVCGLGVPMQKAVATSLFIITIVSFFGFTSSVVAQPLASWSMLLSLAAGGVTGMAVGTHIGKEIAGPRLERCFVVLMLLMAIVTFASALYGAP